MTIKLNYVTAEVLCLLADQLVMYYVYHLIMFKSIISLKNIIKKYKYFNLINYKNTSTTNALFTHTFCQKWLIFKNQTTMKTYFISKNKMVSHNK